MNADTPAARRVVTALVAAATVGLLFAIVADQATAGPRTGTAVADASDDYEVTIGGFSF